MKVILIAGLPGSGKTWLAETLAENSPLKLHVIDDPTDIVVVNSCLSLGYNVVVTDPKFCDERVRTKADLWIKNNYPKAEIDWIFFENDPEKCLANVARRVSEGDDRKVENFIKIYKEIYKIPEGFIARKIWTKEYANGN